MSGVFRVTSNALPEDARVVGAGYGLERHAFFVTVESEEFDLVPDGEVIPRHPGPSFTRLES